MKRTLCLFLALIFAVGICFSAPVTITAFAADGTTNTITDFSVTYFSESDRLDDGWSNDTERDLDGVSGGDVQDEGKTAWEDSDEIFVTLTSQKYGTQTVALIFDAHSYSWAADGYFRYAEGETPDISAIYAPCYERTTDGSLQLKDGMQLLGMTEYIAADCEIVDGVISISFDGAIRDYSRLRIVGLPNQTLTVTTTDFIPAGYGYVTAPTSYTLTTDEKGNAYLYGTFIEDATVSVKQGNVTLADYAFTAAKDFSNGTEQGKSYVLEARPIISGDLGGKLEANEDDITALVEQLKYYVDNGITTIIVTGSQPATIELYGLTRTAIGEAIYRLTDSGNYDENNPYNGKIDLILQDVTEIMEWEFYQAYALNSITLPKVTTIGDLAFQACYHLKQITFGSVLTEVNETSGVMFYLVGRNVGGCDLILNCGQMNESSVPTPDLTTNTWKFTFENEFKSITLTHTKLTSATCTQKAVCEACGESYGEVDTNAHNYGAWTSNGDGTHTRTCSYDNTHTEKRDCFGGMATCTEKAVCALCGEWYGEKAVDAHNLTYSVNGNVITATCSANCGYSETATITAENTTYNGTEQKTATVTYSEGWKSGDLTVSYENNTNAGTATASITLGEATASVDFSIAKAIPVVTPPTPREGMVYTNLYFTLYATRAQTTGGTLMYKVNDGEWGTSAVVNGKWPAGTYTVYYKVVGDENYE